jgi:benzoate transport
MDLRDVIRAQPMRRFQYLTVATCLVVAMVDGYDLLVMAFAAPFLGKAWSIGPVDIGYLLSASVFGSAIGAVLISPLGDHFGRRPSVIACMGLIVLGLLGSTTAQNYTQMIVARVFSGLWMGAVVPSLNVIAAEYSSRKRLGAVMGVYGIGFPLGAALGGAMTNVLVPLWGWRSLFGFACAISAVIFLFVLFELPESIEFLIEKRPENGLTAYNKIASKLGFEQSAALPRSSDANPSTTFQAIFQGMMATRTLLLWFGYGALTAAFYFANSWTPKLVAQVSGDPALGVRAGTLILVGGVLGSLLFAALSWKVPPRIITMILMAAGAGAFIAFGQNMSNVSLAMILAVAVGVCANGGVTAFIAISPPIYSTSVRATGVGWMLGFGRGVSILAPIFTGYLLERGWKPNEAYQLFGGGMIIACFCAIALDLTYRGRVNGPVQLD